MRSSRVLALLLVAVDGLRVPQFARRAVPTRLAQDQGGALAAVGDQFEQIMAGLPMNEKYNSVLESLLNRKGEAQPVLDLLDEMTAKRIKLEEPALRALVNWGIAAGDLALLQSALVAARKNGAVKSYAAPSAKLAAKPSGAAAQSLAPVPADTRGAEVALGGGFVAAGGLLALLELADLLDFSDSFAAPPLWAVGGVLGAGWAYDRYEQRGEAASTVGRGVSRLFDRDLERECTTESASFVVGYLLGMPAMAYAPNVERSLDLLAQAADPVAAPLPAPPRLLDRLLIWMLAPAAAESLKYSGELTQSDPAIGARLLEAARRREASLGVDVTQGGWGGAEDDDLRLRWAYSEARKLCQRYSGLTGEVAEQMAAGSSAGDCATTIERRLKSAWAGI